MEQYKPSGHWRKVLNMNGNTQKWLIGILSTIVLGLFSALYFDIKTDIQNMDTKVEQIQSEYYRIAVIESQLAKLLSR